MRFSTISLLQELHEQSEGQSFARARAQFRGTDEEFSRRLRQYLGMLPSRKGKFLKQHGFSSADAQSAQGTTMSLAISEDMGRFLYNLTLMRRPARILELGSSYGVSTLYLASALQQLGKGEMIASELDSMKCRKLKEHLNIAGVASLVAVWEGDAFELFNNLAGHFDLVFMDVWSTLYLKMFQRLEAFLQPGSVVITDHMYTAQDEVADFRRYLSASRQFSSSTLDFASGVEFTVMV
ncbi:SAM-dependent methyltransferase [Pseudoduganella sp. FT26W]|uniref:SAM-dependent methyltransferase n=1 Tax=Duganella aquatilis TaxID=2666082 RepID=A0A844DGC1_9BURK|nr:class I SAM-dependent methyltransferase [Duganella aquatilis]MRW88246.1 SAM-dependent methyltransferase [Duganella aquatilis]